jgi:hypothetical protein
MLRGQARQGSTAQQDTSFKFAIGPGSGYRFRLAQEASYLKTLV